MPTLASLYSSTCASFKPLKFFELTRDLIVLYGSKPRSERGAIKPDMLQVKMESFVDWTALPKLSAKV